MTSVPPSDLSARLAQLSPERRALLERALRKLTPAQPVGIARRGNDGPAPLSYAQEFLWLIEQAYPGRAPYNVPRDSRRLRRCHLAQRTLEQRTPLGRELRETRAEIGRRH